jgi:hypothetical protein
MAIAIIRLIAKNKNEISTAALVFRDFGTLQT